MSVRVCLCRVLQRCCYHFLRRWCGIHWIHSPLPISVVGKRHANFHRRRIALPRVLAPFYAGCFPASSRVFGPLPACSYQYGLCDHPAEMMSSCPRRRGMSLNAGHRRCCFATCSRERPQRVYTRLMISSTMGCDHRAHSCNKMYVLLGLISVGKHGRC